MHEGHRAVNVDAADVVVVSSAVRPSNPEVAEAKRRGIPVIPRAEMLAELMRLKFSIAVAGSHGKTTTTSMIALVLERAGLDPTAVIGGRLSVFGSNARLGRGQYLVAEADESDRSFLMLWPSIAVITNIDREHMESYGTLDELQTAFVQFANKVPFYGSVIACADDPHVAAVLPRMSRRVVTYGFDAAAGVRGTDVELGSFGGRCQVTRRRPEAEEHLGCSSSPCRDDTTCRMRWRQSRWVSAWAWGFRRWPTPSGYSMEPNAASSATAKRTACWSSMTMVIIRPR